MQQKPTSLTVVYCLYRLSEDTEFFPDDAQKIDWSELVFLVERAQEQEIDGKIYVCVLSFLFVLFCSFPFKMWLLWQVARLIVNVVIEGILI